MMYVYTRQRKRKIERQKDKKKQRRTGNERVYIKHYIKYFCQHINTYGVLK